MYMTYEQWLEEVENSVYVYLRSDLEEFLDEFGLDLYTYYEANYSPEDVVAVIDEMIEYDEEID